MKRSAHICIWAPAAVPGWLLCAALGSVVKVPQQTWGFSEWNKFKGNCSWKAITYIEFGINRQADRVFLAALCLSKQILDNASFLAKQWVSGWDGGGNFLDFHSPHLTRDHANCLHLHIWKVPVPQHQWTHSAHLPLKVNQPALS